MFMESYMERGDAGKKKTPLTSGCIERNGQKVWREVDENRDLTLNSPDIPDLQLQFLQKRFSEMVWDDSSSMRETAGG